MNIKNCLKIPSFCFEHDFQKKKFEKKTQFSCRLWVFMSLVLHQLLLNLLLILGSLFHLHGLQMLLQRKPKISRNSQILASFASRISRRRLLLNNKRNKLVRSYWIKPGRTKTWWEKLLNNKDADTEWVENFRTSWSFLFFLFFLPSYNPATISSKAADQQTKTKDVIVKTQMLLAYLAVQYRF